MTYTYAIMEVSKETFEEIKGILLNAGYGHAVHERSYDEREVLDMRGIALAVKPEEK